MLLFAKDICSSLNQSVFRYHGRETFEAMHLFSAFFDLFVSPNLLQRALDPRASHVNRAKQERADNFFRHVRIKTSGDGPLERDFGYKFI